MKFQRNHRNIALSVGAFLLASIPAFATQAEPQKPKFEYTISNGEEKFDVENRDWLKPGWSGALMAGIDDNGNAGASITFFMEEDGLVICSSTENQADNVITNPKHCNGRLTLPGYHIPPQWIFKGEPRIIHWGKIAVTALPLGVAQVNLGLATSASAVVNNVVPLDPVAIFQAGREIGKSVTRLAEESRLTQQKHNGVLPTAPMQFKIQDLIPAMNKRIKAFMQKCNNITDRNHPNKSDLVTYNFCKRQNSNVAQAGTILTICNLPIQNNLPGEPGSQELWRLGQPLPLQPAPVGCAATLAAYNGAQDDDPFGVDEDAPTPTPTKALATSAGAVDDVTTATQQAMAAAAAASKSDKPEIDRDTGKPMTVGKVLLGWARSVQVAEWLAEKAPVDDSVRADRAAKSKSNYLGQPANRNKTDYDWMLFKDPAQADPAPPAATPAAGSATSN